MAFPPKAAAKAPAKKAKVPAAPMKGKAPALPMMGPAGFKKGGKVSKKGC